MVYADGTEHKRAAIVMYAVCRRYIVLCSTRRGRLCPETRRKQRHPQSDFAGNTRCQTSRTAQEDMAPKIKDDMTGVGVTQDVALDRNEWRRRTRPTPRKYGKGHEGEQGDSAVQYWKRKIGRRRTE